MVDPAEHPTGVLAVLSPVAGAGQLAPRAQVPTAIRVLLGVVALLLTVEFLDLSVGGAVHALHHPASLDTVGAGRDSVLIANYLWVLVLSLVALAASWGVSGIRAGGFPRGVGAAAGRVFTGAAALVYVPLVCCTTVQVLLTLAGAVPRPSGIVSSVPVGLVASLSSGVSEEVFVVAVPVAVFDRFVRWRPVRMPWLPTAVTVVVLASARLSYHVYYGWTALVLAPWAVLSVVVYLRTRAVLPLMALHVVYDAVLQLPGVLGLLAVVVLMAVAIAAAAARVRRARDAGADPGTTSAAGPAAGRWPATAWTPAPSPPSPWGAPGRSPSPSRQERWEERSHPASPGPGRGPTGPSPSVPPGRPGPR